MALDSYVNLQASVLSWLARPDDPLVAPAVPDMIHLFEAEANRRLRVIDAERVISLPLLSDGSVDLPEDCWAIRSVNLGGVQLEYRPQASAVFWQSGGEPRFYSLHGQNSGGNPGGSGVWGFFRLYVGPIAGGDLTLMYQVGVPPLGPGRPTNWLLQSHSDAYLFGTLAEAELYIGHDERAPLWLQRREAVFQSIENADRKTRWAGPMQIRAHGITTAAGGPGGGAAAAPPVVVAGAAGFIAVGDAPPPNPSQGSAWWDGVGGQLYLWVIDASGKGAWVPATNTSGTAVSAIRTEAPVSGAVIVLAAADRSLAITSGALAALTIHLPPGPAAGQEMELWFAAAVATLNIRDAAGAAITGAPTSAAGPGEAVIMRWTGSAWVWWD
jgi:hypothetical protein